MVIPFFTNHIQIVDLKSYIQHLSALISDISYKSESVGTSGEQVLNGVGVLQQPHGVHPQL